MDEYPYPIGYGVSLCPAEAEPAFESAEQQELGWGREWGAHDEVGILRRVLVRSPGNEFERVRADCWDERAQALVDPRGRLVLGVAGSARPRADPLAARRAGGRARGGGH